MPGPYAQELYRDLLLEVVSKDVIWLDLGCGRELIRSWLPCAVEQQNAFKRTCRRLVGIDAVEADVRANPYLQEALVGDLLHMPFEDGEFNLLSANMVLEHIKDPEQLLKECHRVLQPGGRFVFLTPNLKHWMVRAASLTPDWLKRPIVHWMDGREEQESFPTHYKLNTVSVCRTLLQNTGFAINMLHTVDAPPIHHRFPLPKIDIIGLAVAEPPHRWQVMKTESNRGSFRN